MLACAHQEVPLPLYGNGQNSRDWLYVEDHVRALWQVYQQGTVGESYHVSGQQELSNIELVKRLCLLLDQLQPRLVDQSYTGLMTFVTDRPGHDVRYALNSDKLKQTLHWQVEVDFDTRLRQTVAWYLESMGS